MVQVVCGGFNQQAQLCTGLRLLLPFVDVTFELTLAVLDGAVVLRPVNRAVDRDHHRLLKHTVHRQVIVIAGIVPFKEQRRTEL